MFARTSIGRLEDRMNLVSIFLPPAVDRAFPHLRRNLAHNRERLITWFDVHLMMQEFAVGSFKRADWHQVRKGGPINPARAIVPKDRTCGQAGIPLIRCVCGNRVHVDPREEAKDTDGVKDAAMAHFRRQCPYSGKTDITMTSMSYEIPILEPTMQEQAKACFRLPSSCRTNSCLFLMRDLAAERPIFSVVRK